MKSEEIEHTTDAQYQEAMIEMVKDLLKVLDGHDALFGMQALLGALANVVIDSAPDAKSATHVVMGMAVTTVQGIQRAFDLMEDESRLDGEEDATHEVPFRMQ